MYDYDEAILDELYGSEEDEEIATPEDELHDRGMSQRDFL